MIGDRELTEQLGEENELVEAARRGEHAAFDLLVRRYADRVFRVALAMLGNRDDASDVQQETFLRAYRKIHTFRGQSSFTTWLHAITARMCLMRRRGAAYRREEPVEGILFHSGGLDDSPENIAVAAESAERVRQVLARMAPKDRLLVVLKYVDELGHKEIAQILGCSEESSRSRLARAKRLFRDLYREME